MPLPVPQNIQLEAWLLVQYATNDSGLLAFVTDVGENVDVVADIVAKPVQTGGLEFERHQLVHHVSTLDNSLDFDMPAEVVDGVCFAHFEPGGQRYLGVS